MDEDLYFSEYKMFTDYEIDEITVQGIRFKNGMRDWFHGVFRNLGKNVFGPKHVVCREPGLHMLTLWILHIADPYSHSISPERKTERDFLKE